MTFESTDPQKDIHWADITATRIIRQKGEKEEYVLASGITPSGTVHFGNFREVITVDLVARALRRKGKKVRFIFSWDDYDTFRKVPANLPKQDELEKYLFHPIVETPDPFGKFSSYAEYHEKDFEEQLTHVSVDVDYIYQAQKYRNGDYSDQIIHALKNKDKIVEILNQHRSQPLPKEWLPVSVYCPKNKTDKVKKISFDGDKTLSYVHENDTTEHKIDITKSSQVKLPWRVDWPMRWAYEKVDFEPGGKDHSSQGGSYTTAKEIVKLFDWEAPVYLQYDFVSIKGAGGKMSSSKGNLVTLKDVLKIYEPEMVRWIFASYKSNVDFSLSFDLDVLKIYEDFDRQERLAYGLEKGNEKKTTMAKRVYELSQIGPTPDECPAQPSFRHLCNLLQINDGHIGKTKDFYTNTLHSARDQRRFQERAERALYWLDHFAPEEFKFKLNSKTPSVTLDSEQQKFLQEFKQVLNTQWDDFKSDKDLHEKMYEIIHQCNLEASDIFPVMYQILISKEKGPKLAGFIRTVGKERVVSLL